MINVKKNIEAPHHQVSDQDLVEISGYHAYMDYTEKQIVQVNGNNYRVKDIHEDTSNGLNAITFQSLETKEMLIAYTGTDTKDKKDIITDAQLLSDMVPDQVQAANDYFNKMEQKFGPVSYVCGNSLGGGNANAVGVANPHVKTVTLNPALLPEGVVDYDKEYTNITNYFGGYDVLTKVETGLFLGHRIPGKQIEINHGIPDFSYLATNHTGYIGKNETGEQIYMIGQPGQPGYGAIYIDADAGVVSSIWTGQSLHYGQTDRIDINTENMQQLADSLGGHVNDRMSLVKSYLSLSGDVVEHEGSRYYERLHTLQENFREMFEDAAGSPLFSGITRTGNIIKNEIYHLITLLDTAESKAQSLNYVLNSPPAELVEFVFQKDLNVDTLFGDARNYLFKVRSGVEELTDLIPHFVAKKFPEFFEGGTNHFSDAVVGEIMAHYEIVGKNNVTVKQHLKSYENRASLTAGAFAERDKLVAGGISTGVPPGLSVPIVGPIGDFSLQDSPYLKVGMKFLEVQLDIAFLAFTQFSHSRLLPLLGVLEGAAVVLESVLEGISAAIKGAVSFILNGSLPMKLAGMLTDFDEKIQALVNDALEPLDELANTVEGLRRGLGNLIVFYPTLLNNFKPYIETALFSKSNYYSVHLYNLAAMNILEEMDMLFKDIVHQLSGHKANAIDALHQVSAKVKENMAVLHEQVDRGTL
ncbi:SA1320 family protein [Fictibacillus aquaticus]|uniref:Uncharacterized protein n=1 Tax=Fictibacillus aquaticus TaxID=2021314 RepID=A0A235F8T9_9BACL|nr:DUF2974 domain-containing protein [Fictibacillus aquaticus]OYD57688.1 hypothetical protein CGZ90_13575 [Fictibacillus aquaticus]